MRTWDEWERTLQNVAEAHDFQEGYKALYSPRSTVAEAKAVFISLNPGKAPDNVEMRAVSDEQGNSYEIERETTKSPITRQFLLMCQFIGLEPKQVLTGVAAPFRSGKWDRLSPEQRKAALSVGLQFWSEVLDTTPARLIITCSDEAANMVLNITGARLERSTRSGWGKTKLERYIAANGTVLVRLPHLSRHKLFSRMECKPWLRAIFEIPASHAHESDEVAGLDRVQSKYLKKTSADAV